MTKNERIKELRNELRLSQAFNVNPQWLESGEYPIFLPSPDKNFLDRLAQEKGLNDMEKALIGSIIDLPRPAREAVIDWAFKLIISVEAQITDQERESQIRELERSISEQQAKLDKLKEGANYAEDTSTGLWQLWTTQKFR